MLLIFDHPKFHPLFPYTTLNYIELLIMEERVNSSTCPNDFDETKAYFKTLANSAVNKKYKSKILRNSQYNFIAINLYYQRDTLRIGIMLLQKAIGVDRVYACKEGVYLQASILIDNIQLYGLEILAEANGT